MQAAFDFDARERLWSDQRSLYALFGAMVRVAGGVDWLTAALDKNPFYSSKISEGMNSRNGKHVQLDWLAPLLSDPRATDLLLGWLCERCGYEPPVTQRRKVTDEDYARAAREVLSEIKDDEERGIFRRRMAKKLGLRIEDVKF